MLTEAEVSHFRAFGFVVVRQAFDAGALGEELDRALDQGVVSSFEAAAGGGEIRGQYVPMMTARTTLSLSLLDRLAAPAARLLGGPVLPTRAKAVRYFGSTPWHTDSPTADLPEVPSVGFAAYLDPLDAGSGALRVIPGSHHPELGRAVAAHLASLEAGAGVGALPAHVVITSPGDVIAFDERLYHASTGGESRRQWRLDYLRDPVGAAEEARVRAYFASIYPPDWSGGYDVDRYPSYGPDWLASARPAVARLAELGVYELAAAQEAHTRRLTKR